jgi:hypothetical protein
MAAVKSGRATHFYGPDRTLPNGFASMQIQIVSERRLLLIVTYAGLCSFCPKESGTNESDV